MSFKPMNIPDPNLTTKDVLNALQASGMPLHQWGRAVDGSPLLSAQTGGTRQPAVFITAGCHSHEPAGVLAALNLLRGLETEHEVHILPLRDPFGFAGVNHCLSVASGKEVQVPTHRAALDYLLAEGELLAKDGEFALVKLVEIGFLWHRPTPGSDGSRPLSSFLTRLMRQEPDRVRPLWGKSVMLLQTMTDVEGVADLQRCYHRVINASGEFLHLNRFFGRDDAPPEVMAVENLMRQVKPGLTCDLHEGAESGFWLSVPKPEKNPGIPLSMARAFMDVITSRNYPITPYEEWAEIYQVTDQERVGPEPTLPGLLWTHPLRAGEGHNLGSFASLTGIAFDTEPPLTLPLVERVDGLTNGIMAAIKAWEKAIGAVKNS